MFLWGWYLDFDPGSMLSYFTKDQIENWSDCGWWDPEYEELYKQQGEELDPVKRKEYVDRMQQILYEQTPYIVTDYGPDFEAYNTDKWEGYIAIPDPNGNTLIPPFGNGGLRQLPEHRAQDGRRRRGERRQQHDRVGRRRRRGRRRGRSSSCCWCAGGRGRWRSDRSVTGGGRAW